MLPKPLLLALCASVILFATTAQTPPSQPTVTWQLDDDRRHVTITFPTTPSVMLRWDAGTVEDTLEQLGNYRADMWPDVPSNFQLGQQVRAISNPRWATEPTLETGETLLHIRDPRFGWLHYVIPRDEARKLSNAIQNQVNAPPPR